jgi:hypothetical protein
VSRLTHRSRPPSWRAPGSSARGQAPARHPQLCRLQQGKSWMPTGACRRALDPGGRHDGGGAVHGSISRRAGITPDRRVRAIPVP